MTTNIYSTLLQPNMSKTVDHHMLIEKYHKLGIVFFLYTEHRNIEISHETILPYKL
jgi:hypothetical protein